MLTNQERQDLTTYQTSLISRETPLPKGHLSSIEREKMTVLHAQNYSIRKIAKALGRSPSTISRELRRKEAVYFRGKYVGGQTHINAKLKWKNTHQKKKLDNAQIRKIIRKGLKCGLSPQLIAGRLREKYDFKIHHETIYQYIYKQDTKLTPYLLRSKYGRVKRAKFRKIKPMKSLIPNRIDIDLRMQEANLRSELGHFECDSVVSGKKGNSCLTVIVDRATRKTTITKTHSKTSIETNKSIIKALKCFTSIKSITYDNGMEFAKHTIVNKRFTKKGLKSFFCKPYHSWEKGTVENINGLIRRFFPKGTNFDTIKNKDIKAVENWINNRPMKVLNYMTPNEKYKLMKYAS